MVAPLQTQTLYKKPDVIEKCQHAEYLKSVSTTRYVSRNYLRSVTYTIVLSILMFYLTGPNQARINNSLLIRKNNTQIIEYVISVNHLHAEFTY